MLDRLVDVWLEFIERFYVFYVIRPFEKGVLLRCGKFSKVMEPGFHWIIPLLDTVMTDVVVTRTFNLPAQSLTTKDGKTIVVGAIITACIYNIRKAILDVEGVDTAVQDSCIGEIADAITSHTWDELNSEDFVERLRSRCHERATDYGIRVSRVRLSDKAVMRALRIHMDQQTIFKE